MLHALLQCPICTSGIKVAVEIGGQLIACPNCQNMIQLPEDLIPFADSAPEFSETANQTTETDSTEDQSPVNPDEVDETELFAPGFIPSGGQRLNIPVEAQESMPSFNLSPQSDASLSPTPETELRLADESNNSGFELKLIPHPLLPPTFQSSAGDFSRNQAVNRWRNTNQIVLPSADGGLQTIDSNTIGIKTSHGRVIIASTPKEKKEYRIRLRSLVVYAMCAILLVVVMWVMSRL